MKRLFFKFSSFIQHLHYHKIIIESSFFKNRQNKKIKGKFPIFTGVIQIEIVISYIYLVVES